MATGQYHQYIPPSDISYRFFFAVDPCVLKINALIFDSSLGGWIFDSR